MLDDLYLYGGVKYVLPIGPDEPQTAPLPLRLLSDSTRGELRRDTTNCERETIRNTQLTCLRCGKQAMGFVGLDYL